MKHFLKSNWELLLFAIVLAACFLFAGCKNERYIYVTDHDTVIESHLFRDTIDRWQYRYEYIKGDTVIVIDSLNIYKTRYVYDTLYEIMYKDRDKEIIKEKKVYVWQPFALLAFGVLVFFLLRIFLNQKNKNNENK